MNTALRQAENALFDDRASVRTPDRHGQVVREIRSPSLRELDAVIDLALLFGPA